MPNDSVHCVVTSPPYWGLRDYGVDGQIGLERTPEEYVAKIVEVFREVRRVLRDDGTLWLNLGDSYWGGKGQSGSGNPDEQQERNDAGISLNKSYHQIAGDGKTRPSDGKHEFIKPKDLVGIPWRVAFALQADGWYLRSDIIWSKPNPMPESVTDRPTKAHEYLFLLTKNSRYFYDSDAIREKASATSNSDGARFGGNKYGDSDDPHHQTKSGNIFQATGNRNRRTVWEIATQPTPEAHFATFPEALVEPCIKAGTSERGCCPVCGSPWERMVEKGISFWQEHKDERWEGKQFSDGASRSDEHKGNGPLRNQWKEQHPDKHLGWQPTCTCGNPDTIPCVVLDPFGGSGTTAKVARNLKRDAILIELNTDYVKIMRKKLRLNEQLVTI